VQPFNVTFWQLCQNENWVVLGGNAQASAVGFGGALFAASAGLVGGSTAKHEKAANDKTTIMRRFMAFPFG